MIKNRALEFSLSEMVEFTKDNGKMDINMAKVFSRRKESLEKVYGTKGKEFNGLNR